MCDINDITIQLYIEVIYLWRQTKCFHFRFVRLHGGGGGGCLQEHDNRCVFQTKYCFSLGTGVHLSYCIIFCDAFGSPSPGPRYDGRSHKTFFEPDWSINETSNLASHNISFGAWKALMSKHLKNRRALLPRLVTLLTMLWFSTVSQ